MTRKKTGSYSAEQFARILSENKASLKLPKSVDCADASTAFKNSHKDNWYETIKLADGKTVAAVLNDTAPGEPHNANANKIKNELSNAIRFSTTTNTAIDNFKNKITTLNTILATNPRTVEALAVTDVLAEYRDDFKKAITAQQTQEINALEALFKDNDTIIASAFNITNNDASKTQVKDDFLKALKDQHAAQEKAFDDPVNKVHNKLHDDIAHDLQRLNLIATHRDYEEEGRWFKAVPWFKKKIGGILLDYQAPENMKKEIEEQIKAANAAQPNQSSAVITAFADKKGDELRDVDIDKLKEIQTLTGRIITKKGKQFTMIIPSLSAWDWWNLYNREDVVKDIRSLAETIRAQGFDEIKFTIQHGDEETAKELAGIAYAEALKAGFEPEKIAIEITVNGKDKPQVLKGKELETLFNRRPNALENAMSENKKMKDVLKDLRSQHGTNEAVEKLKADIEGTGPKKT